MICPPMAPSGARRVSERWTHPLAGGPAVGGREPSVAGHGFLHSGAMGSRGDRPPLWARAWASRHRRSLARYATGSVASTIVSQVVLGVLYALDVGVAVSSTAAYLAGVPVNYLLQRRWTWGHRAGGSRLLGYLATVGVSTVVVVALTTALERLITAAGLSRSVEVVLVGVAFLGVNGLVFGAKYVLFDRLVFADGTTDRPADPETIPPTVPTGSPTSTSPDDR